MGVTPDFSDVHLTLAGRNHVTNEGLYDNIPKISQKIQKWRLNLVGHCYRHKEEAAAQLILWRPKHGKKSWGQPAQDFAGTLAWDSGINWKNLGAYMMEQTVWRGIIAWVSNPPWLTDWWRHPHMGQYLPIEVVHAPHLLYMINLWTVWPI